MEYTCNGKDEKSRLLEEFYCEDCLHIKYDKGHKQHYCDIDTEKRVVTNYDLAPMWCQYRRDENKI